MSVRISIPCDVCKSKKICKFYPTMHDESKGFEAILNQSPTLERVKQDIQCDVIWKCDYEQRQ